uniref:Uncharacterized protein n=1 Tax=Phaeomonas parva TaxID=124430 RepID=A0A7S1TRQ1_9STRA|mmetsp:Transcript_14692/g.44153  ORF Transcript_14692/g.44153 Transcript_14692/m.44153 type:complete len:625 (+) Transcript_14692:369-2243(+)
MRRPLRVAGVIALAASATALQPSLSLAASRVARRTLARSQSPPSGGERAGGRLFGLRPHPSSNANANALPDPRPGRQNHRLFGLPPPAWDAAVAAPAPQATPRQRVPAAGKRWAVALAMGAALLVGMQVAPAAALSLGIGGGGTEGKGLKALPLSSVLVWLLLFVGSACLHSAETAITTLYPWKVREFAEEEGEKSPFAVLSKDITRVLTTVLLMTTACTIYSAALFTRMATEALGPAGTSLATAILTVITVFFGELLPKALGVGSAEVVARRMVPPISAVAVVIAPLGKLLSTSASGLLRLLGFDASDKGAVSEEELRLIVSGAKASGGIETEEGAMIENVLDLADKRVSEVMRPRVELVALDRNETLDVLLSVFNDTKYSRYPVYEGEIDRIVGVALAKDLLQMVQERRSLTDTKIGDITQPTYFVPEAMSVWSVLEEMRRRRLHMAVVVDEYGGTAGLVTLEDILEEVVGEIYDEEDEQESRDEEDMITVEDESGSYLVKGSADLEDVAIALDLALSEEDAREFGTLSGFLCAQAGEIPIDGDVILVGNLCFTVLESDERRIICLRAENVDKVAVDGAVPFRGENSVFDEQVLLNEPPPTPSLAMHSVGSNTGSKKRRRDY